LPDAAPFRLRDFGGSLAAPDGAELQGHAQPTEDGFPDEASLTTREPEILKTWEETRLYEQIQKAREGAELFVLHDGPPFANGDVHMGTALNKILKDLVVKSKSMAGFRAPYVPGWDCHGLPIEYKVVKETRGLSPLEVRKRSEEFARKFVDIQRGQFKRLGVLG
jgi:isoleucyl-tRNA synthetase